MAALPGNAQVADQFDREIKALMSDEEEAMLRSILARVDRYATTTPRPAPTIVEPDRLAEETDVA